ncbi:hypothetical protein SAMN05444266_107389 [Chitinophaga jiangningensis]|uniref:TonB protein C-terminal n=1 Tax=Chitinophaga jiangningensis TaxID=1419482 RepID=A0A1M7HV04_9BACT|nr:hypothetical protein [Chitinophaga jiangningensis]SHM32305.1 hypothetical protein SAMN05444266_107389 [Chitinophaga jiangningensis]
MPDQQPYKHQSVSSELIRQYLAGELDDKAMHDLERQALDDPFLAEALEGFETVAPQQQPNLDDLHARLNARVAPTKTRVRPMYYRYAAAAAILLLLATGGWYLFREPAVKPQIAGVQPQAQTEHQAPAAPAADTAPAGAKKPEAAKTVTPPVAAMKQAETPVLAMNSPQAEISDTQQEITSLADSLITANDKKAADTYSRGYTQEAAPALMLADSHRSNRYTTQAKEHTEDVRGMGRQKALLSREKAAEVFIGEKGPEPEIGLKSYQEYLSRRSITSDPEIAGSEVYLIFSVKPDGGIDSVNVITGKNIAATKAAITIIKDGPKWKPAANGQPANVSVRLFFRKDQ